jgi:hypothetical protein
MNADETKIKNHGGRTHVIFFEVHPRLSAFICG